MHARLQGQALDVALDIYEWLISGRDVTEPIPADITTYNTLIKACHQVRGRRRGRQQRP